MKTITVFIALIGYAACIPTGLGILSGGGCGSPIPSLPGVPDVSSVTNVDSTVSQVSNIAPPLPGVGDCTSSLPGGLGSPVSGVTDIASVDNVSGTVSGLGVPSVPGVGGCGSGLPIPDVSSALDPVSAVVGAKADIIGSVL